MTRGSAPRSGRRLLTSSAAVGRWSHGPVIDNQDIDTRKTIQALGNREPPHLNVAHEPGTRPLCINSCALGYSVADETSLESAL